MARVNQSRTGSSSKTVSISTTSIPSDSRRATARSHSDRTSSSRGAYPRVGDHATLVGSRAPFSAAGHDASGLGSERMSVGSGPTATSRAATTSAIRRAMGPLVDRSGQSDPCTPPEGTRPSEGLTPLSPQHDAGIRIEPPPSDPVARGTMPEAMAAAEPPDEPPGVWARFHGLEVAPKGVLTVSDFHPSSGVFVFPT